jgi:hypothetical protein
MIHWILRNRWLNCDELTKHIFFIMSHIYREDNQSTNDIATRGLQTHDSQWWDTIHNNINNPFTRNRLGLTYINFGNLFWTIVLFFPSPGFSYRF